MKLDLVAQTSRRVYVRRVLALLLLAMVGNLWVVGWQMRPKGEWKNSPLKGGKEGIGGKVCRWLLFCVA